MHIDIIETSPSLAKLEDNWNAVYDADDEAHVFLSWQWLVRRWISRQAFGAERFSTPGE